MTPFDKLRSVISFCDDNGRSDLGQIAVDAIDELRRRPKWNGGFAEARRIALKALCPEAGIPTEANIVERLAEALVEAFDDGVLAEHNALFEPRHRTELLVNLLRDHGIGIATLSEMQARTLAIARGELKPKPNEPKLWFCSIEAFVERLKRLTSEAQSST